MYKKILSLFLVAMMLLSLTLATSSCNPKYGDNSEVQGNTPNEPDIDAYLPITADGVPTVTVVSAYSKTHELSSAFNAFIARFKEAGITLKLAYAASDDPDEPEILIGDRINASDEYYIDPHSLGEEGYAIRVKGNKLIVAAGCDASLVKAISILAESVFKLNDTATDIRNLSIPRSTDHYHRQDYPITSISIGGKDISGYDIVCDLYDPTVKRCAEQLQRVLYFNSGYWLNIRDTSDNPSIRITLTNDSSDGGFRVYVDGDDMVIAYAFPSLFEKTFNSFISDLLNADTERSIDFEGTVYTNELNSVCYSDYGAVGDGVTDDYAAIKATHDIANSEGLTVYADPGKTYNLGQHSSPIRIKTDTVWEGATFIIDDSEVAPSSAISSSSVFAVIPGLTPTAVKGIKSLSKGQMDVGRAFNSPMLLHLIYEGNLQYIRYGNNADNGSYQQEIILVDENGNVDPSTPIMWDYPELTSVSAYYAGDRPITILGGKFITIANAAPREYTYYSRNITINRSNVTVDGLEHYIEGEGDTGAPYNGFITVSHCHNVLIKNAILTGHKVYKLSSDSSNSMGTYDISAALANGVTFQNCRQSNSITDTKYWGIMGSNYCKNLTYDGCVFSRFDAHKGTHNATIINSEIGHQKLSVIGSGTLRVENTTVHGNSIVGLRTDYGSTWDGDMIFKNVTLINTGTVTLIGASWYNHYFGYTCNLPENIIVDGIKLTKGTHFYVLPNLKNGIDTDTVDGKNNSNKIVLTKRITVLSNPNNYTYSVSVNDTLFDDVELVVE